MSGGVDERAVRIFLSGGMTKAESNRAHAKKRAMQRFGLNLKRRDLDAIRAFILSGQAVEVLRQSEHITLWHMHVGGHDVVVVFDAETSTPVTFLTPEMAARQLAAVRGFTEADDDDE